MRKIIAFICSCMVIFGCFSTLGCDGPVGRVDFLGMDTIYEKFDCFQYDNKKIRVDSYEQLDSIIGDDTKADSVFDKYNRIYFKTKSLLILPFMDHEKYDFEYKEVDGLGVSGSWGLIIHRIVEQERPSLEKPVPVVIVVELKFIKGSNIVPIILNKNLFKMNYDYFDKIPDLYEKGVFTKDDLLAIKESYKRGYKGGRASYDKAEYELRFAVAQKYKESRNFKISPSDIYIYYYGNYNGYYVFSFKDDTQVYEEGIKENYELDGIDFTFSGYSPVFCVKPQEGIPYELIEVDTERSFGYYYETAIINTRKELIDLFKKNSVSKIEEKIKSLDDEFFKEKALIINSYLYTAKENIDSVEVKVFNNAIQVLFTANAIETESDPLLFAIAINKSDIEGLTIAQTNKFW